MLKNRVPQILAIGLVTLITLSLGLLLGLFILISPTQARQVGLSPKPAIDVVATAQAIQAQHQQTELEAAGQARQTAHQTEIAVLEQTLADTKRQAQTEISQLEAHLISLNAQIKESETRLTALQSQIAELQQTIQADQTQYEADLAALEQEMARLEAELQDQIAAASAELDETYAQLAAAQTAPTIATSVGGGSSGGSDDDHATAGSRDSGDDEHGGSDDSHDDDSDDGDDDDDDDDDDHDDDD